MAQERQFYDGGQSRRVGPRPAGLSLKTTDALEAHIKVI